jgi:hypothetical protein
MKTHKQILDETELLQDQILPSGRRDRYSQGHAMNDAYRTCKDWQRIRAHDREAALFLAVEILKDAELHTLAHFALLKWFDDDADKILKNLQ